MGGGTRASIQWTLEPLGRFPKVRSKHERILAVNQVTV
jgi:hypothetical protein